jgi:hypothetical protein
MCARARIGDDHFQLYLRPLPIIFARSQKVVRPKPDIQPNIPIFQYFAQYFDKSLIYDDALHISDVFDVI